METNDVILRHLLDLCRKSEKTGSWQYSGFLSPAEQDDWLRKIQESCDSVGIVFRYDYVTTDIHDRSITTDTGWRILLGRGLDIYQPCERNDAFVFATRIPSQRNCKAFTVTYLPTPDRGGKA